MSFADLGEADHDDLFQSVDADRNAHIWLLYGGQGTGKTYTSLTWPEPIFVIDTELRSDLTIREKFPDKEIKVFQPGEISFEGVDPDNPLDDAIDIPNSLNNLNDGVVSLVNGYRNGELEGGTVIVDSMTDVWDWCQEWGKQRLMEAGDVNEANFRLDNQFDWGMIKGKHYKILTGLRTLAKKYDVEVVWTARERERPNYDTGDVEHYIKAENSVPFWSEINIRFTREVRKGQTRHIATFDKLGANNQPDIELVDPSYEDFEVAIQGGEEALEEHTAPDEDEDDDSDSSGGF